MAGCCKLPGAFIAAVQLGLVTMFQLPSNKTKCMQLFILPLKVKAERQSPENQPCVSFRLEATFFFYKSCGAPMTQLKQQSTGLELKAWIHCGARCILCSIPFSAESTLSLKSLSSSRLPPGILWCHKSLVFSYLLVIFFFFSPSDAFGSLLH